MNRNIDLNINKKIIFKFLSLSLFFLVIFYFFIFKNIILYNEIRENIINENIRFKKLNLEKNIIEKAFEEKSEQLKKFKIKLKNILLLNKHKKNFASIPEILEYVNIEILRNNLELINFARSYKNEQNIDINLTLEGKEDNIKKFIRTLENSQKNINFFKNSFKFLANKKLLIIKLSLSCSLEKNLSKNEQIILQKNKNNIFFDNSQENNTFQNSFIRIGDKKIFKLNVGDDKR